MRSDARGPPPALHASAVVPLAALVGVGLLAGAAFDGVASGLPLVGLVDALAGLGCLAIAAAWRRKRIPPARADAAMLAVAILAVVPNVTSVAVRHAAGSGLVVIPVYLALVPLTLGALLASRAYYAAVSAVTLAAFAAESIVVDALDLLATSLVVLAVAGGWLIQSAQLALARARAEAEAARVEVAAATARAERLETLGTLVGSLSHEINNPLMFLGLSVEGSRVGVAKLLGDPSLPAPTRAALDGIRDSMDRAERGVARVKATMRALLLLAGETTKREPVDVHTLLADSLLLAQMRVPTNVDLTHDRGPALPVLVDPRDLFQVVLALVADASDSCARAGGKIRVAARAEPPHALVLVEDAAPPAAPHAGALSLASAAALARRKGWELKVERLAPADTRRVLTIPAASADADDA